MAFVRPQTAQQAVLADLRRAIREGELKPGEQIVQETLAERYGLSRVPVRDALRILEGEGQVTYQPHHGYFVTVLDIDELTENYRIRRLLESDAATVALKLITDDEVEEMARAAALIEKASADGDLIEMSSANRHFHFTLLEASRMQRMVKIIAQLWDATEPYRSVYYTDIDHRNRVNEEHRAILEAVRARDRRAMIRLLDEHRTHAINGLTGGLREKISRESVAVRTTL